MGKRGPRPAPTAVKIAKGNPGRRALNKKEPQPRRNIPPCPNWLSPRAKAVWKRIVPKLREMGVLTIVDGDAIAAYSQAYARWRAAEEFLAKHGDVYPIRDENGRVRCMQQFPQVAIARNLMLVLKSYQQEFGMTPSARTTVEAHWVPKTPEELEDEAFALRLLGPIR